MLKNRVSAIVLILLLCIFWTFLFHGPRAANDFPFASRESVEEGLNFPQTWSSRGNGIGQYGVSTLWAWPIDFLYGTGAKLGINFSILERIFGVFPIFILGVWSILKLLEYFKIGKWGRLVGTLVYLINTYIILLVDGGQFSIGLAYAFFPFAFLAVIKSVTSGFTQRIFSGMIVALLGLFDIRFVYVLAILLLIYFIYNFLFLPRAKKRRWVLGWVKSGLITTFIYLGLNAYWILPALYSKAPSLPDTYTRTSQASFLNFTQLKHAVSLLQPHWYENIFGKIAPFRKEFLLIPVLVFLAPLLRKRNKQVWFWTIVAFVSVFLTKGTNPPFPEVYLWLFTHIPGFSLFRDSTKFFFLVALSYSILISFTVNEITRRLPRFKIVFPFLLILYLLFLVRPVYLEKMTGIFSEPRYKAEYFSLANELEEDKGFGRILWVPARTPLGFSSPTHPSVEASRLASLRPFEVGTVGTYETQNFIREANYMGELFDIAGIKYLAYPYFDTKRDDASTEKVNYYNTFLGQIENLPWISKKVSEAPIPVFETKRNEDKFFLSNNTYFIVGSDRIYQDIKSLGGRFSDNALIFVEESPGSINEITGAKIILHDKTSEDLVASFIKKDKFISPSTGLGFSPNETGWWKRETADFLWLRDFLQVKYGLDNQDFDFGYGYAISEGQHEQLVTSNQFSVGKVLMARLMKSRRGGKVSFYQGGKLIGEVDTKIQKPEKVKIRLTGYKEVPDKYSQYDKADFAWFRIGNLIGSGNLTIKTDGDINVVNTLALLSEDELAGVEKYVMSLERQGKIIYWNSLSIFEKSNLFSRKNSAKISYSYLSPTHYKVKVQGLAEPATLAFSETHDPFWQANGKGAYPIYSLINGFYIDHDGEYDIYFSPQKYVIPGLVVSGTTLLIVISLLLRGRTRKSKKNII